jgi:hypothetical protein
VVAYAALRVVALSSKEALLLILTSAAQTEQNAMKYLLTAMT